MSNSDKNDDTDKAIEEMLNGPEENNVGTADKKPESKDDASNDDKSESTGGDTDKPAQDESGETDWKAESRKWEARAKANRDEANEYKAASEKVAGLEQQLSEANNKVSALAIEVSRYKIAAKYGVSEEDVELFLTASDEETLEKQAERLSKSSTKQPKPDAAQGKRTDSGPPSTQAQGAAALEGLFQ